jgi:hypothetical protein
MSPVENCSNTFCLRSEPRKEAGLAVRGTRGLEDCGRGYGEGQEHGERQLRKAILAALCEDSALLGWF